jgi:hypothetical protein
MSLTSLASNPTGCLSAKPSSAHPCPDNKKNEKKKVSMQQTAQNEKMTAN